MDPNDLRAVPRTRAALPSKMTASLAARANSGGAGRELVVVPTKVVDTKSVLESAVGPATAAKTRE